VIKTYSNNFDNTGRTEIGLYSDEDIGLWTLGIGVHVDNFPGVREFTNSHAFVEEVGQPFWHNATRYFQKFGWNVFRRTIRFYL